jgi:hypothetical protein
MSRAFVKDAEDTAADLPDRSISEHRNLVTPEGLRAIEAALGRFEAAHRARSACLTHLKRLHFRPISLDTKP